MDENRRNILIESTRALSKLHLLAAFFADEIVMKVYVRSQVIHQLFENNSELDVNKLELFHLQFTDTVIELLRKIKKSNERNVSLLFDEIQVNADMITRLEASSYSENDYRLEKQRQALKINNSLRKLYEVLSHDSSEYPFSKNINSFSARFASGFYPTVEADVLAKLTQYEPNEVYTNAHAVIQRKLMGLLCKYDFKSEFYSGLKSGSLIIEVFRIKEPDIYYIFYPSRNLFLLCDAAEIQDINNSIALDKPDTLVQELKNRNDQLHSSVAITKTFLPNEIRNLLADHYKKISDINFLQNMSNFDTQANVLKAMLNTDLM
ncbi:hypothetical protein [Mucilaginibacter aquatilis]|uniref:Uncharacterized protein n=1 Tax=Mucilaginibacter aquatilis TaxID=1517760 RepID=A0A6I4IAF2_9SPHI|nr:hypothetical protein [Mucilaginibacter aquatilis]MVN90429.1 hypothetical protein [Mucilaginibacter aquatilis]